MESGIMNGHITVKIIGKFYDPIDSNIKYIIQMETADSLWRGINYL